MVNEVAQEYNNSINELDMNEAADSEITRSGGGKCLRRFCITVATLIGVLLFILSLNFLEESDRLDFSLGISSIEGLSPPSSCQTCTTISPTFTLAIYVDNSHNHLYRRCFISGETRVFYQSVEIAAGPIGEFCADKSGEKDVTVHAWSMELELPAFLRDQLYEETMKQEAVFDVELSLYQESDVYPLFVDFHVGN